MDFLGRSFFDVARRRHLRRDRRPFLAIPSLTEHSLLHQDYGVQGGQTSC